MGLILDTDLFTPLLCFEASMPSYASVQSFHSVFCCSLLTAGLCVDRLKRRNSSCCHLVQSCDYSCQSRCDHGDIFIQSTLFESDLVSEVKE